MYIMHIDSVIEWSEEKAEWLKKERGISFEAIAQKIESGDFEVCLVDNQTDHKDQKMFLVDIDGYRHCVPFIEHLNGVFLKTAFKSRKHQKEKDSL